MNRFICRTQTWTKFYLCSFGFVKRNCSYKICALCHFPRLLTSELTVAICKNYYSCYHFDLFATSARPAASRFCMIHGAASGEQMVSFHGEERERRREGGRRPDLCPNLSSQDYESPLSPLCLLSVSTHPFSRFLFFIDCPRFVKDAERFGPSSNLWERRKFTLKSESV